MTKQREHTFITTKKIAGQKQDFIVTYHMHKGNPVLHGTCTRTDTGAPYPVSNWRKQLEKEVRVDMFEKALGNNLYQKGDRIAS